MADTSDIKRRVTALEDGTCRLVRAIQRLLDWLRPRRRHNRLSRALTPTETRDLRRQMRAHGVPDDEGSDVRTPTAPGGRS
jgi:hypothetical protein